MRNFPQYRRLKRPPIWSDSLFFLFVVFLSFLSSDLHAQVTHNDVLFTKVPLDLQLVARDPDDNDRGIVEIEGEVDRTLTDYDEIRVDVFKGNNNSPTSYTETLNYSGDTADFSFSIKIKSELKNYDFEIYGVDGGSEALIHEVDDVVAGDVYIINGQSNAVAKLYSGSTAGMNDDGFVRVYASGTLDRSTLLGSQARWYLGQGDSDKGFAGNTGQWGMTVARKLIGDYEFPVAIFNGGSGGKKIKYFDKTFTEQGGAAPQNNYERLLHRLTVTGLASKAKAILWSQGENTGGVNGPGDWEKAFEDLIDYWKSDFTSVSKIYIFQTRRVDCTNPDRLPFTMEDQRALSERNNLNIDVEIMSTNGLEQFDDCHFVYAGGYREFGLRIWDLLDRDFYDGPGDETDITPPNIIDAYMLSDTQLLIQTDATALDETNNPDIINFELVGTTASIQSMEVSGNQVIFNLDEHPGFSASITNLGADFGEFENLVQNQNGIEMLAFTEYPIDGDVMSPNTTTWNGSGWSDGPPTMSTDVIIDGRYTNGDGSFVAKDLTINGGERLTIGGTSSTNTVTVYGDLTIDGTFIIRNQGSLVMYDDDAVIEGEIQKEERSAPRNNVHDFTYWSSSVADETIGSVFPGVNPLRIFYYDQSESAATDPDNDATGTYWNVWKIASQGMSMLPGKGYAAEGEDDGLHEIEFNGVPNNGVITVDLEHNPDGNDDNDFNLIGNPYPSAIDIDAFITHPQNSDVLGSGLYLWTHATQVSAQGDFVADDYVAYSTTGGENPDVDSNFGSGQGFFMRVDDDLPAGQQVIFNNSMRIPEANNQFFKAAPGKFKKSNEEDFRKDLSRIWLELTTDQGGSDHLLIGFKDGLTQREDKGWDVRKFPRSSNPISFYSMIGREKFGIQGLKTFVSTRKINLGFDTDLSQRVYRISVSKREGALLRSQVYLYDRKLNKTHDLLIEPYSFVGYEPGENPRRFILMFDQGYGPQDEPGLEDFEVRDAYNDHLAVFATQKMTRVQVYDFSGNLILDKSPEKDTFVLNVSRIETGSILIVSVQFESGTQLRKKTIKL